jgi:hypothetical protein
MDEISIIYDLYWFFKIVVLSLLISCVIVGNILMAFRISFFFKSYRDPINALKREHNIESVIKNQEDYEKMNGA